MGRVGSRSVEVSAVLFGRGAYASSRERPRVPVDVVVTKEHLGDH